jgi:uncharacterized membrane protein
MNSKLITVCRVAIAALLGMSMPWLIMLGNPLLPAVFIVVGMVFTWLLVRNDKRTLVDERAQMINQKAQSASMYTFLIGTAILGLILVTLGNGGYPDFFPLGYTLMYADCSLLVLNLIFGTYYRRKYGG